MHVFQELGRYTRNIVLIILMSEKKLLSFDFAQSFNSEFRESRYTTGHNRTSE